MREGVQASARRPLDHAGKREKRWSAGSALALCMTVAMVFASLATSPALAKGPAPRPTGSEQCWVDPNPVNDGQRYTVWGSGFAPSQNYTIFVGSGTILMTSSDALGLFSSWDWAKFGSPASVTVTVYFQSDSRHRNRLAQCTFQANGS